MREPKVRWEAQKVYQRISLVKRDVSEINQEMNRIDGMLRDLVSRKWTLQRKVSKKAKYLNKLKEQLEECRTKTVSSDRISI
jgi:chromosome segregation ATPase